MKANFAEFIAQASAQTGRPVVEVERVDDDGVQIPLDGAILDASDTLIVISFDSLRTGQQVDCAAPSVPGGHLFALDESRDRAAAFRFVR